MGLKESGLRGSLRNVSVGIDAIPDSEDLHAHYDFSEYSSSQTSNFEDLSGNGHDLVNGSITDVTASINGVQAGNFDGDDDGVFSNSFSAVPTPYTTIVVCEMDASSGINTAIQQNTANFASLQYDASDNQVSARDDEGGAIIGGDNGTVLISHIRDEADSKLRTDQTEHTGDSQFEDMDVLSVGSANPRDDSNYFNGSIGEVLVYPSDKFSIIEDIEQYLIAKWNLTI